MVRKRFQINEEKRLFGLGMSFVNKAWEEAKRLGKSYIQMNNMVYGQTINPLGLGKKVLLPKIDHSEIERKIDLFGELVIDFKDSIQLIRGYQPEHYQFMSSSSSMMANLAGRVDRALESAKKAVSNLETSGSYFLNMVGNNELLGLVEDAISIGDEMARVIESIF